MSTKISILSELTSILSQKEKTDTGGSHFFQTVQNRVSIKAVFISQKTGKNVVVGTVSNNFKPPWRDEHLFDAANRPFRDG